jgi:hypothetical protein
MHAFQRKGLQMTIETIPNADEATTLRIASFEEQEALEDLIDCINEAHPNEHSSIEGRVSKNTADILIRPPLSQDALTEVMRFAGFAPDGSSWVPAQMR